MCYMDEKKGGPTNLGGVDVGPSLSLREREGTAKFGGLLPLLCAVVGGEGKRPTLGEWCHCWVPLQGDDQLWGSGRGAIAGHWHPDKLP